MELEEINLLDRDRFTHGIPHEWFTYLRREAPIWRHPEPDGPGFWVVTKHEDVVAVGRDGETFSSDVKRGGVVGLEEETPEEALGPQAMMQTMLGDDAGIMLMMDAPQHTRYRMLVNKGFTPRMINQLMDEIRQLTSDIIDEIIERGEADFVVDVAAELTLQIIAQMLGVPVEDRHKLFDWSNRMIGSEDPEYAVTDDEALQAQMEMFAYANELKNERRESPRDDIVTALLTAEIDGDQLTDLDFNLFFLLLAVAGNETTRNTMSHGMLALLQNPDQYRLLVENPTEEVINSATEEMLRWASPVMYFRRNVTRDTVLRGQQLRAGDKVGIYYVSANRDEDVFDDPFRFDIMRQPNPHVAFGGGGPHFCLGANLARAEIRILFEEIAKRIPDMQLAGDIDHLRSNFIGGVKHLPVTFTPAARRSQLAAKA